MEIAYGSLHGTQFTKHEDVFTETDMPDSYLWSITWTGFVIGIEESNPPMILQMQGTIARDCTRTLDGSIVSH